jgi:hypothetical protein
MGDLSGSGWWLLGKGNPVLEVKARHADQREEGAEEHKGAHSSERVFGDEGEVRHGETRDAQILHGRFRFVCGAVSFIRI